jgi:hypothetical protein
VVVRYAEIEGLPFKIAGPGRQNDNRDLVGGDTCPQRFQDAGVADPLVEEASPSGYVSAYRRATS